MLLDERFISKEERDRHPASDFAGKNRSFPIFKAEDVAAAAASIGRAGPDNYSSDELKRRIIAIAKRKGFTSSLPASWKESYMENELADDLVPLMERAVSPQGFIDMKIIAPGWGTSGYYSKEVLERDGATAWPAGTHQYIDHPTESEAKERPERSLRDLAAVTVSDPVYQENGKAGPGLYARSLVLPQYRETIDAISPYTGVSIRAHGRVTEGEAEGKNGRIVDTLSFSEQNSIDFVTKPGAGGKVQSIMESLRSQQDAASAAVESNRLKEADEMDELKEAQGRITELEEKLSEAETKQTETDTKLAEAIADRDREKARADALDTAVAVGEARKVVLEALKTVDLPDASKERITSDVASNPPMAEGKLDVEKIKTIVEEKAKTEAEYLERVVGKGGVRGMGAADKPDPRKALEESFKQMYLSEGKSPEEAEKLAAMAASGR
jgi:hypothetical protein